MSWWPWRRRRSTAGPAAVWTAGNRTTPTPTPTPADPGPRPPACAWSVTLTDATGTRRVHGPEDACCTWALTVVDLDPVPTATDHDEDGLWWDAGATRVTPGRATTPLHRTAEHRRTELGPDRVSAVLERSRRPDEEVVTTAPDEADPTTADGAHERAAAVWARHLDALHARGARPAPMDDGPGATAIEVGRRLTVRLSSVVSCDGPPDLLDVLASCEASLTTAREAGGPVPTAPRLAAWVEVAGKLAAADTPTGPLVTSADLDWERLEGDGAGVAVRSVPIGDHTVRWRGTLDVSVPADEVAVVVGHALHLEATGDHATEGRVRAEAATVTRLRLALGATAGGPACPCATADLAVEVDDDGVVLRVAGQDVPVTLA